MRVHAHPADDGGCGWYRLRWPVAALQAGGADIAVDGPLLGVWEDTASGPRIVDAVADSDVVVLQRPLKRVWAETIPLLQRHGTAVVVEIDDDFHALPQGHPARREWTGELAPRWLRRCCEQADLVTCSTPALAARYAAHGRSAVLPNLVPARYLDIVGEGNDRVTVGWPGVVATHPGDLEVTGGALGRVVADEGAEFRAVGSARALEVLGIPGEFGATVPWADLHDGYPETVASLDVGIVPLAANYFNRAKSALKMLELAALGVACVVSPSPDNRRAHTAGIGVLAETPADWEREVRRLVRDGLWRAEVAQRGRAAITEQRWTYEQRAGEWWAAWETALAFRRAARRVA